MEEQQKDKKIMENENLINELEKKKNQYEKKIKIKMI